ncbi:MAG: HAD family acid phosphatase, partial [Gemmatimonadota bacterium]
GTAGDTVNPALADLDATLWTQVSAEYRGASIQAYRTARRQLVKALDDTTWTAALEQEEPYGGKPPAVILDVDETVLDNSAYQARLIRRGEGFGSESWDRWVREARAPAVPGALRFAQYAHRRG